MLRKRHPGMQAISWKQIYRNVSKFEVHGCVTDRRKGSSGRRRSARCDENISQVQTIIEETPQRSIRKVLSDMNQHPSKSSAQRILKFYLKLTPYKISVMQHLKESDIASRLRFTNWVLEHDDILESVWFSDEAHFTLSAKVNKQNMATVPSDRSNPQQEV
ncbi:uncharacterized protein [Argopecten irradians]|uniref:uncharacterized protein n=1 Tax=Argopecten irradians TaxID=31199 RepID=UPI0037248F04